MIQQLKTWMHWNAGKVKRASTKPDVTWLKNAMGKPKGRAPQPVEVYQRRYKDDIEKRVRAEIDDKRATSRKDCMTIRRRVVTEMWKDEDEGVVAEIMEEVENQKKKPGEDGGKNQKSASSGTEERSPEEYDVLVNHHSCRKPSLSHHS